MAHTSTIAHGPYIHHCPWPMAHLQAGRTQPGFKPVNKKYRFVKTRLSNVLYYLASHQRGTSTKGHWTSNFHATLQMFKANFSKVFSVPPNCDTSILQPNFSQILSCHPIVTRVFFSKIFLVPPICDTSVLKPTFHKFFSCHPIMTRLF